MLSSSTSAPRNMNLWQKERKNQIYIKRTAIAVKFHMFQRFWMMQIMYELLVIMTHFLVEFKWYRIPNLYWTDRADIGRARQQLIHLWRR